MTTLSAGVWAKGRSRQGAREEDAEGEETEAALAN